MDSLVAFSFCPFSCPDKLKIPSDMLPARPFITIRTFCPSMYIGIGLSVALLTAFSSGNIPLNTGERSPGHNIILLGLHREPLRVY
jgi:hypothetical protein